MSSPDAAREALAQARSDRAAGAARAARPGWYAPALGLSMALALASFSLDLPAIGVPLGLVIGPVAIELLARQRAGASPIRSYAGQGHLLVAYVAAVIVLGVVGIVLEKRAGVTGAAAVAGLLAAGVTVLAVRAVDRRRLREQAA